MGFVLFSLVCFDAWGEPAGSYHIVPEYERTLDRVVLSMETSTDDLSLHEGLIAGLPDYTEVLMLLPESRSVAMDAELLRMGQPRKVTLVPFKSKRGMKARAYVLSTTEGKLKRRRLKNTPMPRGTVWAQDLFEPAKGQGGMISLLAPYMHKMFIKSAKGSPVLRDNGFLDKLLLFNLNARRLPLVFKGGNILVDIFDGNSIAFCGGDIVRDTILAFKPLGLRPSRDEVLDELKRSLGVDRVVVLSPGKRQPPGMFHLDQAMVLFPGKVAGLTRIVGDEGEVADPEVAEVAELLKEIRMKLTELGYSIVDIEATADDVRNYRYYVNGVPYVNKKTGRREFLMPVFSTSMEGGNGEVYERNVRRLEAIGYKVVPVPTKANERHGGLHCLVNVIS